MKRKAAGQSLTFIFTESREGKLYGDDRAGARSLRDQSLSGHEAAVH